MVTVNLICKRANDKKVLILSHLPTLKRHQQKMEVVRFVGRYIYTWPDVILFGIFIMRKSKMRLLFTPNFHGIDLLC